MLPLLLLVGAGAAGLWYLQQQNSSDSSDPNFGAPVDDSGSQDDNATFTAPDDLTMDANVQRAYNNSDYKDLIDQTANDNGIPPNILASLVYHESSFNPDAVGKPNPNGTVDTGLFQINSTTADAYGIDPTDPQASAQVAADILKKGYASTGSWKGALMAYNGGPKNFSQQVQDYANKILSLAGLQ